LAGAIIVAGTASAAAQLLPTLWALRAKGSRLTYDVTRSVMDQRVKLVTVGPRVRFSAADRPARR